MAKKHKKRNVPSDTPTPASSISAKTAAPIQAFSLSSWIPYLFLSLYLFVEFIPNLGSYDTMGPQWFYLSLVDMAAMGYILYTYKDHYESVRRLVTSPMFYSMIALLLWATLSSTWAFNSTETWVCLVRLFITLVAFVNLFTLFYGVKNAFNIISYLLTGILLLQSIQSLSYLFSQMGSLSFAEIVLGMRSNAGNKNIYAASLLIKIPFALYGLINFTSYRKLFFLVSFSLGTLVIILLNSRTTYLGYLLVIACTIIYEVIRSLRSKNYTNLYKVILIILPGIIAFLFSQALINSTKYNIGEDSAAASQYGSAAERMSSITSDKDESRNQRLAFWKHAIDYTKAHPWKGAGYGNWKLESIHPSKDIFNELSVPLHAHNDFLEFFAELGIPGGLLYIAIFIIMVWITIRYLLNGDRDKMEGILVMCSIGLAAYAMDAFFNFPIERPINQIFFALVLALGLSTFLYSKTEQSPTIEAAQSESSGNNVLIFTFISIVLLLPASFITYQTYQSLIIQEKTRVDMENEPVKLTPDYVANAFPSIPNIGYSTLPLDGIKARYLGEKGRYEEAMKYINRIQYINPHLMYAEFLKALVYINSNQPDSAYKYASLAFYERPRVKNYYDLLVASCVNRKDTNAIKSAFYEFISHRPDVPATWSTFLQAMTNVKVSFYPSAITPQMVQRADSALKIFPNDSTLMKRKLEILRNL
jgi:O-antigen ligase